MRLTEYQADTIDAPVDVDTYPSRDSRGWTVATVASLALTGALFAVPDSMKVDALAHVMRGIGFGQEIPEPNPCLQPAAGQAGSQTACLALRKGDIALVDYGPSSPNIHYNAQHVARISMAALQRETGGDIALTATVIPASAAAKAELRKSEKRLEDGSYCVDSSTANHFMATAAKRTMKDKLRGFRIVEGIGLKACSSKVGGIADTTFGVADNYTMDVKAYENKYHRTEDDLMAGTVGHETLHLFGLMHASADDCQPLIGLIHGNSLDFSKALKEKYCRYDEYGDLGNIMSNEETSPRDSKRWLSPMQKDFLDRMAGGQDRQHGAVMAVGKPVIISAQAEQPSYVAMELPAAMQSKYTEALGVKDVIIAHESQRGSTDQYVSLYLASDIHDSFFHTVKLGTYKLMKAPLTITFGSESLRLQPRSNRTVSVDRLVVGAN